MFTSFISFFNDVVIILLFSTSLLIVLIISLISSAMKIKKLNVELDKVQSIQKVNESIILSKLELIINSVKSTYLLKTKKADPNTELLTHTGDHSNANQLLGNNHHDYVEKSEPFVGLENTEIKTNSPEETPSNIQHNDLNTIKPTSITSDILPDYHLTYKSPDLDSDKSITHITSSNLSDLTAKEHNINTEESLDSVVYKNINLQHNPNIKNQAINLHDIDSDIDNNISKKNFDLSDTPIAIKSYQGNKLKDLDIITSAGNAETIDISQNDKPQKDDTVNRISKLMLSSSDEIILEVSRADSPKPVEIKQSVTTNSLNVIGRESLQEDTMLDSGDHITLKQENGSIGSYVSMKKELTKIEPTLSYTDKTSTPRADFIRSSVTSHKRDDSYYDELMSKYLKRSKSRLASFNSSRSSYDRIKHDNVNKTNDYTVEKLLEKSEPNKDDTTNNLIQRDKNLTPVNNTLFNKTTRREDLLNKYFKSHKKEALTSYEENSAYSPPKVQPISNKNRYMPAHRRGVTPNRHSGSFTNRADPQYKTFNSKVKPVINKPNNLQSNSNEIAKRFDYKHPKYINNPQQYAR